VLRTFTTSPIPDDSSLIGIFCPTGISTFFMSSISASDNKCSSSLTIPGVPAVALVAAAIASSVPPRPNLVTPLNKGDKNAPAIDCTAFSTNTFGVISFPRAESCPK